MAAVMALLKPSHSKALLDLIQSMKVTIAPLVPPCVLAMTKTPAVLEYDLSSVRMVLCGAAPLGKDVEDAFRERLPNAILSQGYGMTEAGPVMAMSMAFARYPQPVKSGSCGTVIRNAEIKIIDFAKFVRLQAKARGIVSEMKQRKRPPSFSSQISAFSSSTLAAGSFA